MKSRLGGLFARGTALVLAGFVAILLSEYVFKDNFLHTFLHEAGFAFLVSVIIWALFEYQRSSESEEIWDLRMERLSNNVFQAVLRKDLPKELLDEANNLVLNTSLIRKSFNVTYTLSDHAVETCDPCMDVVLVRAVMEFEMENVSTDLILWPARLSLPNPVHGALKELVEVISLDVSKGGIPVSLDFDARHAEFKNSLSTDSTNYIPFDAGIIPLQPGETCKVQAHYVMVKEGEDSELLQTLYPANGLRVTVFDSDTNGKRILFASAVHRHELKHKDPSSEPTAKIFTIPGYLLPHQGVLIWWKKAGSPAKAGLIASATGGKAPQSGGAAAPPDEGEANATSC